MSGTRLLFLPARTAAFYLVAFAVAMSVYAAVWPQAPLITQDTLNYLDAAWDLSDGRIDEIQVRTIGYPSLLLATRSLPRPGRALFFTQLGLHLVVVWLGAVVLYRSGAGRWVLMAFTVVMLLPPYVYLAGVAMSECMAQFCLMVAFAGFWQFWRARRLVFLMVASLALSYAILTRPGLLPLAPLFATAVLAPLAISHLERAELGRRFAGAVLLASLPVLAIVAYSTINWVKFRYFGLTPLVGWNLAVRTTAFYDDIADPDIRSPLVHERNRRYVAGGNIYHAVFGVDNDLLYRGGQPLVERSKALRRMALDLIRRNKTGYLQEVARSLAIFWFPKDYAETGLRLPDLRRWDSRTLDEGRGRGGELPVARRMVVISKALESVIAFAFFGCLVLCTGVLASPAAGVEASTAIAFLTCAAIVISNAITACAVDMGLLRQRGSTEVFLVLAVFLGGILLRNRWKPPDQRR